MRVRAACRAREHLLAAAAATVAVAGLLAAATWIPQGAAPEQVVAADITAEPPALPVGPERASRTARDRAPLLARGSADLPGDPLPACGSDTGTAHANGRLPATALCDLPDHVDHRLRGDAARALVRLAAAYAAELGEPLCLTDSYRSLEAQQALAARKPGLAARPGTSEHGWGLAADLACGAESYDTPQHRWLVINAGRFGWGQPAWAQDGGAREEPWHWEYLAGQQGRATAP